MPTVGILTVEQAEELKFRAVEEAVTTYKKRTNKQWAKIVGDNAVLRKTIIVQKNRIINLIKTRQEILKPKMN